MIANNWSSGVTQTIDTVANQTYHVAFHVGSATDHFFFFPSIIDLGIHGGPRMSFGNPNAPTDHLDWALQGYDFTATGSRTTITFLNGDTPNVPGSNVSNNFLTALDDVSVDLVANVPVVQGVPEPSTIALLGAGVAMVMRRRRATASV